MSWKSGTGLMVEIIDTIKYCVKDKHVRRQIYKDLILSFEEYDWDSHGDIDPEMDPEFDLAVRDLHPEWYVDDETEN